MTNYEEQANDFCERTGTTISVKFIHNGRYFPYDTVPRDVYGVVIDRKNFGRVSLSFGQSLANSDNGKTTPTNYDILACLTKYEVENDVRDFAKEFGYPIENKADMREVSRTHKACIQEYNNVMRLFSDVIDDLREIE